MNRYAFFFHRARNFNLKIQLNSIKTKQIKFNSNKFNYIQTNYLIKFNYIKTLMRMTYKHGSTEIYTTLNTQYAMIFFKNIYFLKIVCMHTKFGLTRIGISGDLEAKSKNVSLWYRNQRSSVHHVIFSINAF